jgi:voltage-gated potassium channel
VVERRARPRLVRFAERITLGSAMAAIVGVATTFTLTAALLMRLFEPQTFTDFGSAAWWAVQTVSTVGYGDDVPVTVAGRIVATVVMIFGMALVPAVTSIVVAVLVGQARGAGPE